MPRIKMLVLILSCLGFYQSMASSDTLTTTQDFKNLVGCWTGSITYLDYTSNKPFSMPAAMRVKNFGSSSQIIYAMSYPKEPSANSVDTLFITESGRSLNREVIIIRKQYSSDSLLLVTETPGIDGNDHKPALIRHSYLLGRNSYAVKKEVQFNGQTQWILRNEYRFTRLKDCN